MQNYIDDTGVQVADLVVGFLVVLGEDLAAVRAKYDEAALAERGLRFDYVAWDLYADVTRFYEADKTRLAHRQDTLHAMEQGDNPVAELAAYVAERMVRHHLRTMDRIGVRYDLLPKESDILALNFWDDAFVRLKEARAVKLVETGKNAGCWVMDLPGVEEGAGEDQKVIVRSNGTVTYVGKDIAYQMWKLGLLGRDFHYSRVRLGTGAPAVRAVGDHLRRRRVRRSRVRSRRSGLQRDRHAAVLPAARGQPRVCAVSATTPRPTDRCTSPTRWSR